MTTGEGDTGADQDTLRAGAEADTGIPSEDAWVTLREAERRTGVAVSTLRKWRKRGEIQSRMEPGPTGERIAVPIEAVAALAAQRGAGGRAAYTLAAAEDSRGEQERSSEPTPSTAEAVEAEPPRWAMELLSRADARAEHLLERLAQAERERADAERDRAIERHKREQAEAAAAELRSELERLSESPGHPPSTDPKRRWWERRKN